MSDTVSPPARAVVLGPPGETLTLAPALESLDLPPGPLAAITVGWREEEAATAGIDREAARLERQVTPLLLGERVRRAFARDPELGDAHRALQDGLRVEEQLYQTRLKQAVEARHALGRMSVAERHRARYLEAAWQDILAVDRFHLETQTSLWEEFRAAMCPAERPALRPDAEEVRRLLGGSAAVIVAGGHVAVLRNRLRLFDLGPELARLPVVAWSAGAMALSRRVVLFHDRLPVGSAKPEIYGEGAGVLPGAAFFPDARRRLDLDDAESLGELAGRVAPERAVLLDQGDRLDLSEGVWSAPAGIRLLTAAGEVETVDSFPAGLPAGPAAAAEEDLEDREDREDRAAAAGAPA